MRKTQIAPKEYYHIFNRGNGKQPIFIDDNDRSRFLFLILFLQGDVFLPKIGRMANIFTNGQHRVLAKFSDEISNVVENKHIEIINFALMPNHFHLCVYETKEGGISKYMQRLLNSYTKYFNTKYNKIGHLFQGPYKAERVENNSQLLHLSSYIHRNPREIREWRNNELEYYWSSYQDFVLNNRWTPLLQTELILSQFIDKNEYHKFVKSSTAKLLDKELVID